ncbi:MAG: D-alanyl-D-alanine carboxypeptidase/D-alanyl-D-alanine-endopeptidase [Bacteroidota bacterium]|nr:D-alanyl-D-alanine carboxypeptidase/D-alanyl-D-alanine-endopeptidase [Bacteroidota bacterium]
MKKLFLFIFVLYSSVSFSQNYEQQFNAAFRNLTNDPSFKHATISLDVINTTSGKTVTDVNSEVGVAPASCQKVITASTAFALLGHDYRYKTTIGYTGNIVNGVLNGNLILKGSGDPTLGSWRYDETKEENVIADFKGAISRKGIHAITGHVFADESLWNSEETPDGWIWQDIGNYYGAGARPLNWRENQYDLYLKSGNQIGDPVAIVGTKPSFVYGLHLKSKVTSAAKGSGDNNYIYLPLGDEYGYVRGTTPVDENHFTISGSLPKPGIELALTLEAALKNEPVEKIAATYPKKFNLHETKVFYTYTSPLLDSIIFHFLRRSINLYGEALIKTLAYNFTNVGATDSGVNVIHRFWKDKGIEPYAINIIDGSGLSPSNRVTTKALVTVMEYARKQKWFPSFYEALPTISGIKMKSGSINGVISYTGYIKGKNNDQYTFSFVINNYDGSGNEVRHKMWNLLGIL